MISKIFISHHFDDFGMNMAGLVERLVKSHGIQVRHGKRLQGQVLSQGVKELIDECDATIVLLTDRDEGKTNQWVKDERAYASGKGHRIITLLEKGLFDDGMFSNNERIRIDRDKLEECLLNLSTNISLWKYSSGKNIRLLLQPDSISNTISNQVQHIPIRYRIWRDSNGAPDGVADVPNWTSIFARPDPGGATILLKGIKKDDLIEVETMINGERWASRAANPNVTVKLAKSRNV